MEHKVFIWWMETQHVDDAAWQDLNKLLSDEERLRADRFHFDRDRKSYIAAHALGRTLLSSVAGETPSSWRFAVGAHGKPEAIMPGNAPRWRLNLSHTRGMAAAALTRDFDVGVDIESLQRTPDCIALSQRYFARQESDHLLSVPDERQLQTFLTFWTLKESYIKAIGKGLAQPLDSFYFTLDPLRIHFSGGADNKPENWLFLRHQPSCEHLLALALRHDGACRVQTEMQAVHPKNLLGG